MHSPPHDPHPTPSPASYPQGDRRVCDHSRIWLLDQIAACLRWLTSIPPPPPRCKSCFCHVDVNVCANVLRCVCPAPTLYSFRSIVWGSPFFLSSLSSCLCCNSSLNLVFSSCTPLYPVVRWRLCSGRGDLVQEIVW